MSDLISRADAIEAIMKHHDGELNQINYGLTLAKNEIQALPSALTHDIRTETHGVCLISKDDAIADLEELAERYNGTVTADGVDLAIDRIKALPSADAVSDAYKRGFEDAKRAYEIELARSADAVQGEWIPVSERLPDEGQGVLVTVDANKWDIEVGSCIYSGGTFHSNFFDLEVIAWMPLPTPYKGGDDE